VGIFAEEISIQLFDTISLDIDDNIVTDKNIMRADDGHSIFEDGELVGTYGGIFSVCVITSDLDNGSHTVTLKVRDLSDIAYSHTWEFDLLRIRWPSGIVTPLHDVPADQELVIHE
jgi:hypothetical protein